ncbi:MAG: fibronectin type III domain-containing protein, partial [Bacteroidales bacterium]|nr:fibronectin type III domain-containing protein [Bacteroidales bacterium]
MKSIAKLFLFISLSINCIYCYASEQVNDDRNQCTPITITANAPYTEDFSSYSGTSASSTSGVMPDCWDALFLGTPSYIGYAPHVFYGSSQCPHGSSNNCLLMYAGSTDYGPSSYAIFPKYTNDMTTLELKFSVAMSTNFSSPKLTLGYVTDATNSNSFVALRTFSNNLVSENGVANYDIRLNTYSFPAGARLCFRWTASWESCYIDDVVVRLIPSCIAPDNLAYSNLTSGGVLLEWTPAGSESAWEIDYGTVGHAAGSGSSAAAYGHPYSLGGLVPGNSYDVYVRADCGGGNESEWSGPVSFRVPCAPATVTATAPYTEDFAAYGGTSASSTSGVMPDCWDMLFFGTLNHLGYAPHVFYGGSYAPNGNNNNCLLMYAGSTDYGPSSYAILPQFTNDLATLEIDFSVAMSTNFSSPRLSLGYLSDMTDANTFVAIQTFPNNLVSENGVADYQIRLDGGTYPAGARLCFRWTASWESCY